METEVQSASENSTGEIPQQSHDAQDQRIK